MTDDLGRGHQSAHNKAGNDKITSPFTTSTHDLRDKSPNLKENVTAHNEVGSLPSSRGGHDRSKLGG
jgi:hypothetical protein